MSELTNDFGVNITTESINKQYQSETAQKPKFEFNPLNYLNTRLSDGETMKIMMIRILPFDPKGGEAFHKIHMHNVKVDKSVQASGWKRLPCPSKNHIEGIDTRCPFCDTAKKASEMAASSRNESDRKKYNDIAYINKAREYWIVRCIERGHEADGVKFWLFPHVKKGNGNYDKLMALYQTRMQAAKLQGKESNIFDLYDGKDLILTITRDSTGGNVINITDADEKSPLTTDTALGAKWINDPKKWNEVYTFKNFEYMEILVQGGIPYWSSELGKYVDKAEYEKSVEASRETAFNQNYTEPKVDYSKIQAEVAQPLPKAVTVTTDENVDDLPF
jgi:hypothetical protein